MRAVRKWISLVLLLVTTVVLCSSAEVPGTEADQVPLKIAKEELGEKADETTGHCAGNSEDKFSENSEREADASQGEDPDAGATLAAEVEAAFVDITDLLHEQMKSLSELQNAVQRQVAKVNALKGIAAKGFEAYQQQSGGKVRTIFR
eukprot:325880-Pyramimonas_sp.AAC.1